MADNDTPQEDQVHLSAKGVDILDRAAAERWAQASEKEREETKEQIRAYIASRVAQGFTVSFDVPFPSELREYVKSLVDEARSKRSS